MANNGIEMKKLRNNFSQIFFGDMATDVMDGEMICPLIDIVENEEEIVVRVEIPGINKEDIMLNLMGGRLEIKAEREKEQIENKEEFYKEERSYSGFYRSVELPDEVISEKSEAEYKDGILTVRMPKEKTRNKKRIEIK